MPARQNITTKEALEAWKTAKKGTTTPAADDDVVITKTRGSVAGARLKSKDEVAAFLKAAPVEVREAAMEEIGEGDDANVRVAIPVIITDESVDRDDDVCVADGGVMDEFEKNNVMLFAHDHRIPAIGNGVGVHRDGNAWKGIAHFASKAMHPFAGMVGELFDAKIMKAISQGFIPLEWTYEEDRSFWAMKFIRWEMIEFSACNVGSNRNALAQARSIGIDVAPALDMASLVLDGADVVALKKEDALAIWKMLKGDVKTFDMAAMKSAVEAEHNARVKSDRLLARAPVKKDADTAVGITDWQAVAVMLGATVGSDEFSRAKRANTFAADEADAIAENEKATAETLAKLEAGEVKAATCAVCAAEAAAKTAPTPSDPPADPPSDPPEGQDPGQNGDGKDSKGDDAPAAVTEDQLRSIAETALAKGFGKLATEFGMD